VSNYVSIESDALENRDSALKVFKIEDRLKTSYVFLNKSYLSLHFLSNIINKTFKIKEL